MALGGVRADVVGVVVEAELLGQRVLVRRHVLAELRQRRVAVALGHVAVDLVVGAVLLDEQEDVLDRRRVADPLRDRHRPSALLPLGQLDVDVVVAPAVLLEDRGVYVWLMSLSLGSVNRVSDAVVPCVPCPAPGWCRALVDVSGPRASMPRVLETTTSSPTVAISAGK